MTRKVIAAIVIAISAIFIYFSYSSEPILKDVDSSEIPEIKYKNLGISFQYEIIDTSIYFRKSETVDHKLEEFQHNTITLKCSITNNSDTTVSYLSRSCDEFIYNVVVIPEEYHSTKNMMCNASWFLLWELKSKESFEFNTVIQKQGKITAIDSIGFYFIETLKGFPEDTLQHDLSHELISKVIIDSVDSGNIVWAK